MEKIEKSKNLTALEEANLINETVLRGRGCKNIKDSKPMGTVESVMAEKLEPPHEHCIDVKDHDKTVSANRE